MKGSYYIRNVLFALVLRLNYEELEVQEGESASIAFERLYYETDLFRIEQVRNNLLEYCKMDTLAMVEILNKIRKIFYRKS